MDTATLASIVAVSLAVIGAVGGAYATLRQSRTEDVGQVLTAQSQHMNTLSAENNDLRTRLRHAEEMVSRLREEVWNCDRDKDRLRIRIEELERRLNAAGTA